ncbi:MAG TPA: ABC transporter permease [Bacteroidales bacterium]|nr:ABC transporter permease [Bacteroidales bacterium]
MNKISVIIKREYLTRVRKKSFIIMTILAPVLMASLILVPMILMMNQEGDHKKIAVVEDNSDLFRNVLKDRDDLEFVYVQNKTIDELKASLDSSGFYGILWISPQLVNTPNAVELISKKQPPIGLLDYIEGSLEKEIERQKLLAFNIENLDDIMKNVDTNVSIQTINIDSSGSEKKTDTGIAMALTYGLGLLMYMLIFIFGSLVMRGVIEEKTSRVVEVIISSVKPFQLMMGKIIGIALVGLTQFLIWIMLTVVIVTALKGAIFPDKDLVQVSQSIPQNVMTQEQIAAYSSSSNMPVTEMPEYTKIFESAMNQPWALIITSFIFYFITGYLLYASIFAAIGSAVDNETETQQFMLPVTIPIILGLMVAMGTMQNPESSLAFWCSMIPLTSPIVMMARIPFGVPYWQLGLSMVIMLATFMAFVWMGAKVYRVGILMYGKKASWKEMWKWMMYKG